MYNQLKLITCIISTVKLLFEDYLPKELEPILNETTPTVQVLNHLKKKASCSCSNDGSNKMQNF